MFARAEGKLAAPEAGHAYDDYLGGRLPDGAG
jgi:hypothetical protein